MAAEWAVRRLGDLTENFDSLRVPVKEADRRSGPYPYYGASGIVDYVDQYLFDGEYLLIAEDGENLRSRNTPVAFLARGEFWVNNHAHVVRGNREADTRFLMYALMTANMDAYLTGSTMPKLTQQNLNRIQILAPPVDEQRAIAHILGTLDDKIELNRRTSETLEAIARAIFKSWFVDFDPVRAKAEGREPPCMDTETAALFPDAFEDSELGEIPKGWSVGRVADLCTTQYGYTAAAVDEPVGPKLLRVTDINKRNWIEWEQVPHCPIGDGEETKYRLAVGDIVVARMADPGKAAIVEEEVDAVFASYLVRLKTQSLAHSYYLYGFLKSPAYAEYCIGAMGGSVQANMNAKVIVAADMVIPPTDVLQSLLDRVLPFRQRLVDAVQESRTLAAIRDALLPKLISGQIRVKNAERFSEEVMS